MSDQKKVFKCPECRSSQTIWIGYRKNISGKKRVRRCKNCSTKFTPVNTFPRARYHDEFLIEAVALYCGGMSLAKVKNHMRHHRSIIVSRTSILNWAKKHSWIIEDFSSKLRYVIRGVGHCDSVFLDIRGDEINYWGAMDSKVIFKINSKLSNAVP